MNTWVLLHDLKKHLEHFFVDLPLSVKQRDPQKQEIVARPCAVKIGSFPPTSSDALSAAPFVVLQPTGGYDDPEKSTHVIRVDLRFCIVNDDTDASEVDLHNLIDTTRNALLNLPGGVLNRSFRLVESDTGLLEWYRFDEQVYPFVQAYIVSVWETASGQNYFPANC